jgi:hypothetical protein
MKQLLAKIPVIEKKIYEFCEKSEQEYKTNRNQAITAAILSIPST